MYQYNDWDEAFVRARVAQFSDQVARRLSGALSEEEFRPLRLMNGLYLQLHAYMLRVAIPYGTLGAGQLRQLADIADTYDKGYGHFTTRQNIQFNWPSLENVPAILGALADVQMHAIQTSGNCIRNVTTDPFAGAAAEEVADPRPYAELLRQWSTDHPEFQFLPRKFKIAVTGSAEDRAVIRAHDIGLRVLDQNGQRGFEVIVGGGLGRTPVLGQTIREFLPEADLLPYLEAIVATYNVMGRRDNKYKARIKITVQENGLETFRAAVEEQFLRTRAEFGGADQAVLADLKAQFAQPVFKSGDTGAFDAAYAADPIFRSWVDTNLHPHQRDDHAIVTISLKTPGLSPGDATSAQMREMAALADEFAHSELRITQYQNVVLPHVHKGDLPAIYARLKAAGLASANVGLMSDIIACPGMDYCALATARSIPLAQAIALRFDELKLEHEIGGIELKISGCINACAHHHLGHIGILGLDRAGVENYQVTLGGDPVAATASLGQRMGPGFSAEELIPALERLMLAYLDLRAAQDERFIETYRRLGADPFRAALYDTEAEADAA
ncbi:nitrite/sulfite reductase [Thioclava sp. A2]|uniref:nitrite/sulfite reductase n=1 Tax=Thioclava sp. FCG-A2 TaxID=3080562 RepID=UPI0029537E85|nr:nitrite/sulfite reductase [Thioclava sp. A2]MDV7271235.1 nitrite/sulfite reductase [Thioclava sp. A2]